MKIPKKAWLLAGASALAMGAGSAQAQLVEFGSGTITSPTATSGASIGLLANQINDALTGSALVSGGSGTTLTPGASSAADATTTVNANTISATIAGNLAAPAVGQLYTVNLAGMDGAGSGYAASTIFQLNNAPNVLAGVGVDNTGTPAGATQTIGATFATTLTSTSAVTGNVIGSTAVGNQTSNLAGGVTPGAGVAGGSASISVIGSQQQRTNTLNYNGFVSADPGANFSSLGAQAMPSGGTAAAGTLVYVTADGSSGDSAYFTSAATTPTIGTYSAVTDPGGTVNGVIAATTLQRNAGLTGAVAGDPDTGAGGTPARQIRAITDSASVSAVLGAGATGATLDNSVNAVNASATGNQATTGIAVTGGAPSVNGGLAVLNEQVNSTSGSTAGGAGISALNNAGSVETTLGGSVASSTMLMEGNQLSASATGSAATNTLSADMLVRLNAAASPATGSGTGSISTGALLSQERTTYTETVGATSTLETSAYTTVTADSSGVGAFAAAGATADYLVANIQRNNGTSTTPLAITADTTGGEISLRTTAATTGVTATGSTLALSENAVSATATGARAVTQIGNGTATMLGDGASLAALSLQEATTTSARATVANADLAVGLQSTGDTVSAGGSIAVASNAITASALTNVGTTTLSNIAASGGTLASAGFISGLRNDTTGDNLDAQYAAPLAAISAQRVTTGAGAAVGAASIASAAVADSDVLLALADAAGPAATGSTLSLTGNRTTATAGANQANVGVSFAEGMGSIIPGGAVAASSQLLAPNLAGTSVSASVSSSEMQVIAGTTTAGTPPTVAADSISGGSVTASGNRIAAQALGNQGTASMTGTSLLIAGGAGGAGATADLRRGVVGTAGSSLVVDADASYLVANTQRVAPTAANTMGLSSSVSDGSVSIVAGGSASTFALANNVVTAVGAANVFDGRMTGLSGTGAATQLAVSQQDVAGTAVSATLSGGGAVVSTGNSGLALDGTSVAAALSGGSVSVASNTFRALALMNEGALVVADAGVQDLGTTGGGRVATVSANVAGTEGLVSVSGVEVGAVSQQNVRLDSVSSTVGSSNVTGVRVGLNGTGAITTTSLGVTGNTVDARTMGNTATVAASGDVFAGGVAVANSQNVTQSGTTSGLSATNTLASVGVNTAVAPPIGTASMEVANNAVGSMAVANDAQLQLAALVPGSLGNGNLATRGTLGLSTGTGTSSFVSNVAADYLAANVQTTGGLVANATTSGADIRAAAAVSGGTVALNANRVTAETVGNRASASTALPALNAGYVQTASFQANTGGNLASNVVNSRVAFDASSPSTTVGSSVGLSNNAILASTMGNVFNGTQSMTAGGTNFAQTASRQVNAGTSIAASVTNATVAVATNGGLSTTSMGGNTIGASAMGNVLRATVGAR